ETLSVFRTELTADQRGTRPVLICNATLSAGGAERQFVLLAEAIVAAGLPPSDLHVALFSLIGDRGHRHFLPPLERLGVTVHDLRAGAQDGARLGPATAAFLEALPEPLRSDSAALLALAARLQPRLIHGWQDRAGLAAGLAGLLLGTPRVVMSARNMRPQARGDRTRYARKLYAELARQPGMALTANSNPGARDYEDWLDLGLGQVSRLGNGLDIARFPVFPCEAGPDLTIGGVFRLAANKRPELWLRTVARLRDRLGAHIRPRLVGHGPLRGAILELAETLGLAPLDIAAHLTEPEEIYGGLDCLLLMSRVEGTPNVVLEAQACGLPVAACNVGGVADALAQGRAGGLLLPAEITAEAAAGQLMPWLETLHTPEGPAARRAFVAEGYSKAALRDRVMGLYGGALA
ncbi:MAG: glycosyltransferase, partial [Pseudomonadota bacterium]